MATGYEIRITFRDDQIDLYNYIKEHNSVSGFLKDLAYREMLRDNNYINGKFDNNTNNIDNNSNINPYNMFNLNGLNPLLGMDINMLQNMIQNQSNNSSNNIINTEKNNKKPEKEIENKRSVKVKLNDLNFKTKKD